MRTSHRARPMEILLVEDSREDAHLAYLALKHAEIDYRLTWLRDGEETLQFLFRQGRFTHAPRPDVILLDLSLPKRDGREVLVELRRDEALVGLPVVIMTASAAHEDLLRSEMLQVEGYLVKPIDWPKFRGLVQDLRHFWQEDLLLPCLS